MRKTIWASAMALAAFSLATSLATEARADGANLHSGDVLRPGENMLYGEVGWPDLVFGFQHGMSDKVDLGFRFAFIYGYEYRPGSVLGLGMSVPIRITPLKREKVSLQIHFDPGLKFDAFGNGNGNCVLNRNCPYYYSYYGGGLAFGLGLDFGLDVGIHLTREATLSFGLDVPLYINFTHGSYGGIPLLFGPAFEYHIDEHMSVGGNVKLGPSILAYSYTDARGISYSSSNADIGFIAQAFFAYKL
jgi:hypothetical protein